MADPAAFLHALAQALSVMTLYPDGHPSRERTIDQAYEHLSGLSGGVEKAAFTFLDDEVVFGRERIRELQGWDWARRFAQAGLQRLEIERQIARDEFDDVLQEILARLTLSSLDTGERRQMRPLGIRFGSVGLQDDQPLAIEDLEEVTLDVTLGDEADAFRWMQDEIRDRGVVPLMEAEAVVRSLSVAMQTDRRMMVPLLQLKEFDQYTTTHALNVAVLAMALAQAMGAPSRYVRTLGVAGLLHDIGKIRIPMELLTKPGKLTPAERQVINQHPIDAARIILESEDDLELAAAVAYEHHIMLDGGGYPTLHYNRECTLASRLVHVCDVFDALSTTRPYREAWPRERALAYLRVRAGREFDPEIVTVFAGLMREGASHVRVLRDERRAAVPPAPTPLPPA